MLLKDLKDKLFDKPLSDIPEGKILLSTLNTYLFVTLQRNKLYEKALLKSQIILPDGVGILMALRFIYNKKLNKIAGYDLFNWEMNRLQKIKGKCFFLGSSEDTLNRISLRAKKEFPDVKVDYYSPPYKCYFSKEDSERMVDEVRSSSPDVLFIGMTAPKQEKWAAANFEVLNAGHICCIGAVFDFYAETIKRAPQWIIKIYLEWLYRFCREPLRTWRRYILGNIIFIGLVMKEKFLVKMAGSNKHN